jgi:hypothetical protein
MGGEFPLLYPALLLFLQAVKVARLKKRQPPIRKRLFQQAYGRA